MCITLWPVCGTNDLGILGIAYNRSCNYILGNRDQDLVAESWPSVNVATLTEQAYAILRDRILSGKIVSGNFIREQEVSAALGISRTPVREALGRLASEGFVERIPHRGFRLPKESVGDLLELYPIICALEILAGRQSFSRLQAEDISELRRVNEAYAKARVEQDLKAGIELNDRFHHILAERSGNRRLCELLDELRSEVKRLELWAFSDTAEWNDSIEEHEEILGAIETGKYDLGLEVLGKNRLNSYRHFQDEIRHGEPGAAVVYADGHGASEHGKE
jgi:DNA-binding GntR family transcriptional regulator